MRRRLYKAERVGGDLVLVTDPRHSQHEEAKAELTRQEKAQASAHKIARQLHEAREGGYLGAWYSYIDRRDVERVARACK